VCGDRHEAHALSVVIQALKFKSIGPQNQWVDMMFLTPTTSHCPPPQISFISIDTPSTISPLTSKNPTYEPSPEKHSIPVPTPPVLMLPILATAPSLHKQLITLLVTLPDLMIYAPTISTTMTTPIFRMPLRGTNAAPKFNGTPASNALSNTCPLMRWKSRCLSQKQKERIGTSLIVCCHILDS
jgi:hypothetical protein